MTRQYGSLLRTGARALLLAAALAPASPAIGQLEYPAPPVLSSSGGPERLLVGDFTGDGRADLMVTGPDKGLIWIHAGTATGELRIFAAVVLGGRPVALSPGDFDRDGALDVAWADGRSGEVGLLLRRSPDPLSFDILRNPGPDEATAVVLHDFDGDGWPDLRSAHRGADELLDCPNLGGTLGAGVALPAGDGPDRLVRLSHPGGPSIAIRQSGRLSRNVVVENTQDGSRQAISSIGGGEIFSVDLEGDGVDELVIVDELTARLVFYAFVSGSWVEQSALDVDRGITSIAVAETGPGVRRLAVSSAGRRRASIYEDSGAGLARVGSWYVGGGMGDLVYEDLDGEGSPDIAVAQADLDRVQILQPLGDGMFGRQAVDAPAGPAMIVRGVSALGETLLAVAGETNGQVGVYTIAGAELGDPQLLDAAPGTRAVRFGELDGVAGTDVVSVSRTGGFRAHLADGSGGFTPVGGFLPAGEISDLDLVDVVAGPQLDLVFARLSPPALVVHEGRGDGTFVETPSVEVATSEPLVTIRVKDLDLDGREDLLALGFDTVLTIFLNRAGEPLAGVDLVVQNAPRDLGFGNFNADAFPDIVTINEGGSDYSVVASVLSGVYTVASRGQFSLAGARKLEVADFNGDGVDDFAVMSASLRSVGLHLNTGTAAEPSTRFTPPVQVELVEAATDFAVLDLDGDGRPDFVGLDGEAEVAVVRLSDPLGQAPAPLAMLELDESPGTRHVRVLSTALFAHDLRLRRQPGDVLLGLAEVSNGVFEATDGTAFQTEVTYVVTDRQGQELDRIAVAARVATGAPGDDRPALFPVEYRPGRAVFRMRAGGGVVPRVTVHDLRGRRVAVLEVSEDGGTAWRAEWAGTDLRGRPVSRGRYLVRADLGPVTEVASVHLR